MRDPAQFIRSYDRPLPASVLWLGAVALCVDGEVDWSTIDFHCASSEEQERANLAIVSLHAIKHTAPLMPKFPIHIDNMSLPPKKFTGYVVLGSWNLEALRAIRVRAAKAEVESQSPGLIESAISAIKGHASPWLAMSREGAKSIDRLINARDSSHAAKVALALPGVLCGLLPLGMFSSYIQKLEAGSISDPGSEADLPFQHRSAKEGEIEFKEFIANNPRSETDITGFFADG